MNLNLLKSSLLAVAICCGGGVSEALADTTATLKLTGHTAIVGTNVYSTVCAKNTMLYLNSYVGNGGSATLNYKLDDKFDIKKVKSAELQLYVDSKPNKNRSGKIRLFALSSLSEYSTTVTNYQDGNVKVYSYGNSSSKTNYAFSGTPAVQVDHSAYKNYSLAQGKYSSIDVTDLIKQFTTKAAGDTVYIGIDITNNFAADTYIQGYGSTNQPTLTITYSDESAVNYTISYKFDNTEVSKTNGSIVKGEKVTAELPITIDGQKYYAADGATTSFTVDSADQTFEVALRKAAEYSYTVTNSLGTTIASDTCVEGETVKGNYAQYLNQNGTLCEAQKGTAGNYMYSFVPTSDKYNYNIEYKDANINNVAYFSEGESITGITVGSSPNSDIRCSDGKGGYVASGSIDLVTLQPGKYKVCTVVWGTKDVSFTVKAGETTVHTHKTTGSISSTTSDEFELTKATTITLEGGTKNSVLDYIYITKTAETVSLPTEHTYSTYCSDVDLDFTGVTGVEAYKVKVSGDKAVATKIEGKVKAGEGILLKKIDNAESVTITTTTGAEALADNDLVGATETISDWSDLNAYMLVSDTKFQKIGEGTLAKGKAYLNVSKATVASNLSIYFGDIEGDDTVTAISGVEEKTPAQADAIYTLQGVKVEKAEKGIYIINGKKVLVK